MTEVTASVRETACCVVGAGPAGAMLSLLLARRGVRVALLESHHDFDRDFRGDTVHPPTLEVLDQLGLAERIHTLPHGKLRRLSLHTPQGTLVLGDLTRLRTRYPYVMILPQARLLELLTEEARRYPTFELTLGANVQRLVEEGGAVRGVRYRDGEGKWHEVRAALTVAADGRFSKVRHLAGFEAVGTAPPMDVVWFRLPRRPEDAHDEGAIYVGGGRFVVMLERADEWQIGYAILKGTFSAVRAQGIEAVGRGLAELVPWLADRAAALRDWKQVAVLSVESSMVPRWHRPGLLLIGDAAHVMSPVAGVGINYAIQDAVEAANLLADPLLRGTVRDSDLARVQKRREWPTRVIQTVQRFIQQRLAGAGLKEGDAFRVPWPLRMLLRLPLLRTIPARLLTYGLRPARVAGLPGAKK